MNEQNGYAINPNTDYMASYAVTLRNLCVHLDSQGYMQNDNTVCGQQFDTDHYNVVVAMDLTCPQPRCMNYAECHPNGR